MKHPEKEERRGDTILYTFITFILTGATFSGLLMYARGNNIVWLSIATAGASSMLVLMARIAMLDQKFWAVYEANIPQPEIVTETVTDTVYITPDKYYVKIGNQWIYQPNPGVISQMLRHAASPETRRHFSWRTAREHGYTEREYNAAVNQLKAVGWITDELRNGAPVLDKDKLVEIHDWIRMDE